MNISSCLYQCYCLSSYSAIRYYFIKNARAYCTFYIYLTKPLSKVHVSNNRSNTDYDPSSGYQPPPQGASLFAGDEVVRIFLCTLEWSTKLAKNWDTEKSPTFPQSVNECHKIDTNSRVRKIEHMRSRQNVPGRSKMASKP